MSGSSKETAIAGHRRKHGYIDFPLRIHGSAHGIFYIVGSGILIKRPVFDDFLDGAKKECGQMADVL